jgi:hypothetical protein
VGVEVGGSDGSSSPFVTTTTSATRASATTTPMAMKSGERFWVPAGGPAGTPP